jgi:hypothetical protein
VVLREWCPLVTRRTILILSRIPRRRREKAKEPPCRGRGARGRAATAGGGAGRRASWPRLGDPSAMRHRWICPSSKARAGESDLRRPIRCALEVLQTAMVSSRCRAGNCFSTAPRAAHRQGQCLQSSLDCAFGVSAQAMSRQIAASRRGASAAGRWAIWRLLARGSSATAEPVPSAAVRRYSGERRAGWPHVGGKEDVTDPTLRIRSRDGPCPPGDLPPSPIAVRPQRRRRRLQ